MKLEELIRQWESRRIQAMRMGTSAPLAKMYEVLLGELRGVDGVSSAARLMDVAEAGQLLSLNSRTVARKCAKGEFEGARKTSENGVWRIPAKAIYDRIGQEAKQIPRIWTEDGTAA